MDNYECPKCSVNGVADIRDCDECNFERWCNICENCASCEETNKDVYRDYLDAQKLDLCMGLIYEQDDGTLITEEDLDGDNILHLFARTPGYQSQMQTCLYNFGAHPLIENKEGKTIYEIADENNNSEIIEYLKGRNDYKKYLEYLSKKEIANIKPAKRR